MDACNQAYENELENWIKSFFPTAKTVEVKTIGFEPQTELKTKRNRPVRSYVHNNVNCDCYTDGIVLNTKRGREILDFSKAYLIDRNEYGEPNRVTVVFRYDEFMMPDLNAVYHNTDHSIFGYF